ncbi:unnamed protein product [Prorocentrum cordatum]|uniref:RanBP2-type domain-containing protein n=1 Tax=Prorocentrum cordatum TaxID=2364126 RepID=A0ABN9SWC2_9DINO|nr:unnamed protein product [Polarella glacialis]
MEPASPVYTPALLQGEPPPWAHPTPSPSPLVRLPGGHDYGAGSGGGAAPEQNFLLGEEQLWGICEPYIQEPQEMILGLQQEIQRAAQALLNQSRAGGSPSRMPPRQGMGRRGGLPLTQVDAFNAMPFGSLLNSPSPGNRAVPCEPLREEADALSAHGAAGQGGLDDGSPRMSGLGEGHTQDAAFRRTPTSVSPAVPAAPEPPPDPTDGWPRTSPAEQGSGASRGRAVLLADSGTSTAQPASSRVLPEAPLAHPHGYSAGSVDDAPLDADRSVMVCRHWRSKGWCRLEGGCKFLHPDGKRGTAPKKGGGAARDGAGSTSDGVPPGGAAAASGSARATGTRSSRRLGLGRGARGQHAGGAAGPGDGHASAPAPAHAAAMQGAPPSGPGRSDQGRHGRPSGSLSTHCARRLGSATCDSRATEAGHTPLPSSPDAIERRRWKRYWSMFHELQRHRRPLAEAAVHATEPTLEYAAGRPEPQDQLGQAPGQEPPSDDCWRHRGQNRRSHFLGECRRPPPRLGPPPRWPPAPPPCAEVPSAAAALPVGALRGDWMCPQCGDHQYARNSHCRNCQHQRPANVPGSSGPRGVHREGDWLCVNCNEYQFSSRAECRRCLAPRAAPLAG